MRQPHSTVYIHDISTYGNRAPLSTLPFLAQLSQVLSAYQLKISLQRLEILNPPESQRSQQYISVSIKLAGRLNISSFKQKLNRLVQSFSTPHRTINTPDHESEARSLVPCTTSVIDLTAYSSAEQLYEMQRRQSLCIQNTLRVSKRPVIAVHLFYLNQQEQVLHFILRQNAYTADSFQTFMHELMNLFHGSRQAEHNRENSENAANTIAGLLSSRELEVLQCIAEGFSNREIAQHCVITEGTVKRHINNIYSKLGVRSRTQALMQAKLLGFLSI